MDSGLRRNDAVVVVTFGPTDCPPAFQQTSRHSGEGRNPSWRQNQPHRKITYPRPQSPDLSSAHPFAKREVATNGWRGEIGDIRVAGYRPRTKRAWTTAGLRSHASRMTWAAA